jgi:hypothetical protein
MLTSGTEGDSVPFLLAQFPLERTFALLRRLSGLTVRLPDDLDALADVFTPKEQVRLTAGTSRCLRFPRFKDVLGIADKVRCYLLCRKFRDCHEVADQLGWTEDEVKRVDDTLSKRFRGVRGLAW